MERRCPTATYTGTMRKVETRVRVRYAETDQMGVVYYANYLVWMEVGRVAYCSQVGFEYRDMEREDDAILAVTEARCRYLAPARFDDEVRITTWVKEARSRTLRFAYEMTRETDDRLLATGETLHIVCDREGRTIRCRKSIASIFRLPRPAIVARIPDLSLAFQAQFPAHAHPRNERIRAQAGACGHGAIVP